MNSTSTRSTTYPHFLCIGAQKAGTTWLHANLDKHPDIWLPHAKEIHYFNHFNPDGTLPEKLPLNLYWTRQRIIRRLSRDILTLSLGDLMWDSRFFFSKRDDEWYANLFKSEIGKGKVVGDMTPAYSTLSRPVIQRVHKLMPDVKLIFFLRNPIERAWSSAQMNFENQVFEKRIERSGAGFSDFEQIDLEDFKKYFNNPNVAMRGNYTQTLENWLTHFDRNQLFIGFMEDIRRDPFQLIQNIYKHIGVDDDPDFVSQSAGKKVLKGANRPIPPEIHAYLADLFLPQLKKLETYFSGDQLEYIRDWQQGAEAFAK